MRPYQLDLVDVGVNLTNRRFDRDVDAVLERARLAGVGVVIATGVDLRSSKAGVDLAGRFPGQVYTTCGVHPHNAAKLNWEADNAKFAYVARDSRVVAVGECGLDFNRDLSPKSIQEKAFAAQIELAAEVGKPLFLHERDAHDRFLSVLDGYASRGKLPVEAVVHCFTGTSTQVEAYLRRGLYVGVTGWVCDDRRNADLLRALPSVPLDRLLLETDAPFLEPPGLGGGRRNEPANLPHVCRRVAAVLRLPPEEVARATSVNARRLFGLT